MSDMNIRGFWGRGRELLGRMRVGEPPQHLPGSFSLLALRLERDLPRQEKGHSILVAAANDDAVGVEATMELAWCLADGLGRTVLVIDGTFEANTLSSALGIADQPGIAEFLDGEAHTQATLQALAQPTQHERIALLAHGSDVASVSIRADAVRHLLAVACAHYDFVLVQGSLLGEHSKSMTFSSLVDAALLIAVEESTSIDQVTRGQRLLNDCGARRVALVLANRPRPRRPNGR